VGVALLALIGAAACSDDTTASEPHAFSVERVHIADGTQTTNVVAIAERLVGTADGAVVVSDDRGRNWQRAALPDVDAGDRLSPGPPTRLDDVVVVTGRRFGIVPGGPRDAPFAYGPLYVWSSRDGREWRGGKVQEDAPPVAQPSPPTTA
jgi:hypothetical protein